MYTTRGEPASRPDEALAERADDPFRERHLQLLLAQWHRARTEVLQEGTATGDLPAGPVGQQDRGESSDQPEEKDPQADRQQQIVAHLRHPP